VNHELTKREIRHKIKFLFFIKLFDKFELLNSFRMAYYSAFFPAVFEKLLFPKLFDLIERVKRYSNSRLMAITMTEGNE
jgi:hypothetical protein